MFNCFCSTGVHKISVALMAAKAEVYYDASLVLASQIANFISDMGFDCEVLDEVNGPGEVTVQVSYQFGYNHYSIHHVVKRFNHDFVCFF